MRVMLCDDSALFRRGAALLLKGVGVEVTGQARDVAELTTLMRGLVRAAPECTYFGGFQVRPFIHSGQ
jgi:DNA-binding NarL/FixJ family response regulator